MKSERIYAFLLKLYPKKYRQEYGEEMQYLFSELLKDTYSDKQGIINFWKNAIADTGKSLLIQHIENLKGGGNMKNKNKDLIKQDKVFGYLAAITAGILSLPLIAMQFTTEVDWKLGDFILMGVLIFGMGSIFVVAARRVEKKNRLVVGLLVLAALLVMWVHLAVGIVDTWPLAGS